MDVDSILSSSNNEFLDMAPFPSKKEDLRQITWIFCKNLNAYTMERLYVNAIRSCDAENIEILNRLMLSPNFPKLLEHTRMCSQAMYMDYTLRDLCLNFKFRSKDYETVDRSCALFMNWCRFQKIDPYRLIEEVFAVMDRSVFKKNTLMLYGEPNSGKTIIFTETLSSLATHVGRITCLGANSEFVFQECVNKRLIAIDELLVVREQMQIMKVLLGGEKMNANTKHTKAAEMERTPVIFTANNPIWIQASGEEAAFRTRCYVYNVKSCPFLKDVKKFHPRMWFKLYDYL